jgi:DNA-3-methyladenine glycosylase II
MNRFGAIMELSVRAPFRLDYTAQALRRLAANVVDVVDGASLHRAVRDERGSAVLRVTQRDARTLEVRATGPQAKRWLPTVERMLGTAVDLQPWYERAARVPWLAPAAIALRGLKPPRYPSLWEACAHAVVFQQLSLHAAAAIMRRLVQLLERPIDVEGVGAFPFPGAERWLSADEGALRAAGLSANKVAHLRSVAAALSEGRLSEARLQTMSTPDAARALTEVRGIGPWSASVILLRGMGRLDVFPLRDSGVARSMAKLAGRDVDLDAALDVLGPVRGMLYFHLLLARLHAIGPAAP